MECIGLLRNDIRFLGVGGSKGYKGGTTCLQVRDNLLIDGGNILHSLQEDSIFVEHIFLTHAHLDHIADIPYLFDINYEKLTIPITIYAMPQTIDFLKENIFNNKIWPDFSTISLPNSSEPALVYHDIEFDKVYSFKNTKIIPIEVNHSEGSCGYIIKKPSIKVLFAPDTKACQNILDKLVEYDIDSLIVDCSYPARMNDLAEISKHFSTKSLRDELEKLGKDVSVYPVHIKSTYKQQVEKEIKEFGLLKGKGRIVSDGEYLVNKDYKDDSSNRVDFIKLVSKEKDLDTILKTILIEAMKLTRSEGGTIYIKEKDGLRFKTVINQKLNIFSSDIDWKPVPLFIDGKENKTNVSALCALTKQIINIDDVYESKEFNFEGTKVFDKQNGYRSKSMLVLPLVDFQDEVIGVLQLINKNNSFEVQNYTKEEEDEIYSLAIFVATAITKNKMIDDMEELFLSFIKSISFAINQKSQYGYKHIKNVERLMKIMIDTVNHSNSYSIQKRFSKDEEKQLLVSALVHDIGKIITPDYILNKKTRLETLHDKIYEIKQRFLNAINSLTIQKLEIELSALKGEVETDISKVKEFYTKELKTLLDDFNFIQKINNPAVSLSDEDVKRVQNLAKKRYQTKQGNMSLLDSEDVENLSVKYGNLTENEREKINQHAKMGYDMLNHLDFPKKYDKIPQLAGFHHEKLNGKGYPFGLKEDEIPFEVRMLTLCDIFEALTSSDRPYKKAKTKEEAFGIMDKMADNSEIDKQLFEFFKEHKVFDKFLEDATTQKQEVYANI